LRGARAAPPKRLAKFRGNTPRAFPHCDKVTPGATLAMS
jgi:hypothetical protein